ncbi:MAG: hypothetical protein Q8J78_11925 [Moraxellaceae bacterium]|nr:hypothetical protein [Moraxellaceae bacterium]
MTQLTFAEAEYANKKSKTRREQFLERMNVPQDNNWRSASKVMGEYYPTIKRCNRLDYALKGHGCRAI